MSLDLSAILGKVAPWLAAAAAGPAGLAGMALKTVAETLGASETTVDGITAAVAGATPEQLAALRLAENDFKARMQALGFEHETDLEAIAAADRKDARSMQIATRSWVPAALTLGITAGFFTVLVGMMGGWLHVDDSQALLLMLGSLNSGFTAGLAYWVGTTRASENKTDLLAQSEPVKR